MDKFKNTYRIPSARAGWHDYKGGMYFVTVCTAGMERYFSKICNDEMHLSEIGVIAQQNIEQVHTHYPYAQIPMYVIMPNHIHAIVCIDDDTANNYSKNVAICRDVARNVSTGTGTGKTVKNEKMSQISPQRGSLATVIRGIKSATTRYANTNGIKFAWQSRFHDHIIRDSEECNRIAEYIENNIIKWNDDEFNT